MLITTSADALARTTWNALKYCPKTPPWDVCYVTTEPDGVSFVTSNSYDLSWSICPADLPEGWTGEATVKITRTALEEIEGRAKKGKKRPVVLSFEAGECIEYRGEDAKDDCRWDDIFEDSEFPDNETFSRDEKILAQFREVISERRNDPDSRRVLLNTESLRKLGMLKKSSPQQGVELWFAGRDDTVLAKVGEHFMLAIEPVDPERHKAALGEEATW